MNIKLNSTTLAKALKSASKVISSKPAAPILEGLLLSASGGRLVITATDLMITVKIPVPIASSQEDGRCVVPARRITEHLSLLPDCEVALTTNGGPLEVTWAKGTTSMPTLDEGAFPQMDDVTGEMMDMPAQRCLEALSAAIPACCREDLRPQLCGVHFDILEDGTRIVATDAHTLIYDTLDCRTPHGGSFTVPTAAATLLKGAIRKESTIVRLTHDDKKVCFNLGDIVITTLKVEGKYPNYMSIIPSEFSGKATTKRQELIGSLRRLAACSPTLKMVLSPLSITLSASAHESGTSGREDCTCSYNGQDQEVGINAQRFLDILENVDAEDITLSVTSPAKPILAQTDDGSDRSKIMLFMPISLNAA